MNTIETIADNYGMINYFQKFYKKAFLCYNLCDDDSQIKIPALPQIFLLQYIWSNKNFIFYEKKICFEN